MKKSFPKSFIVIITLIMIFTGAVVGVSAVENTGDITTPVFSDSFTTQPFTTSASATEFYTGEPTTIRNTTRRTTTTTTRTNSSQVPSVELTTYPTSYKPTTQPAATTVTWPQTEPASYDLPLGGYGDGWGGITRVYKYEPDPYTQGYVPTNLPITTNQDGYPVTAVCGDRVYWSLNIQTGEMLIYGEGEIYNMEVPQWWDSRDYIKKVIIGDDVTNISFFAFADCSQLTEVVIGNSVETIGAFAFSECVNLKSVVIPDSVKSIDSMAFYGCTSLESITMSSNIEHLGRNSFTDSGYYNNPENWEDGVLYIGNCLVKTDYSTFVSSETYTVKEGTRVIGAGAFMNSRVQSIVIPESVVEIGECAFRWTEIKSIEIPEGTKTVRKGAFDFCHNLESIYIPASVEVIEEDAFQGCTSLAQIIVDESNENFVVDDDGALYTSNKMLLIRFPSQKDIDTYTVHENAREIADYAFENSQINNISLNDGLERIGLCAFKGCYNLESIVIPDSVNWIENYAFVWCDSLKTVDLGNASVVQDIFGSENNIEYVTLGAGFSSDIYFLSLNSSIKSISVSPDNEYYSSDEYGVLYNKDKTVLYKYPAAGERTSYEIPYGVQIIDNNAFSGATNLSEITLPASLTSICASAFYECTSIREVYYTGSEEDWEYVYVDSSNFDYIGNSPICLDTEEAPEHPEPSDPSWWDETTTWVYEDTTHNGNYPSSSTTTAPYDEEHGTYGVLTYVISNGEVIITDCDESASGEVVVPDEIEGYPVTKIGDYAFYECSNLTRIEIPEGITEIGFCSFGQCHFLTEVSLPSTLTSIVDYAFYECSNLTRIEIPEGITEIGFCSFGQCHFLTEVSLPSTLTSIGNCAFEYCENLISIDIPKNVSYIGQFVFEGCSGLASIIADSENTVYSSDEYGVLFNKDKTELMLYPMGNTRTSYSIPDSIINIGNLSFYDCDNLTNIDIPDSITFIDSYAFEGCESLTNVYFVGTQEEWNAIEILEGNEPLYNATVHYNAYSVVHVSSENVTVNKGETVSVPVIISGNPGFMGFSLIMEYDKTVMTPVCVTAGEILGNGTLNNSIGGNMPEGKLKVMYTADENVMTDGVLFNVEFEIDEEAYGDYEIKLSYIQNDTFNEEFEDVVLTCKNSTVTVVDPDEQGAAANIYIEPMQVNAGEEIIVPVYLDVYRGGFGFSDISLSYNSEIFTFREFISGEYYELQESDNVNGKLVISNNGISYGQGINDTICYVTFSVKDYIEGTETISISCNNAFSYDDATEAFCRNGEITIINPHADEPAVIYTDEKVAVSGGYVDIPVYINNNQGIMGFRLDANYDSGVLEMVSVSRGDLTSAGSFNNNIGTNPGNVKIIWSNIEDVKENGLLFTVRFKVLGNEKLTAVPVSFTYSQPDTYNESWEDVRLDINIDSIEIYQLKILNRTPRISVGERIKLGVDFAKGAELIWNSDNPSVAIVDENGVVTGRKAGEATISVQTPDGFYRSSVRLTVDNGKSSIEIFNYGKSNEMKIDWWKSYSSATMQLGYRAFNCENAAYYKWISSNSKVKVKDGNVANTGFFARSSTITVTAYDENDKVIAKSSIKVRFYKFDWQFSRLDTQEFVSDNYEEATNGNSIGEDVVSKIKEIISEVISFLGEAFGKTKLRY